MMTQTGVTEETLKKVELRLNDIIRLEDSLQQLNTLMLTAAAHVRIDVRTPCGVYSSTPCIIHSVDFSTIMSMRNIKLYVVYTSASLAFAVSFIIYKSLNF